MGLVLGKLWDKKGWDILWDKKGMDFGKILSVCWTYMYGLDMVMCLLNL